MLASSRIAELLQPYVAGLELPSAIFDQLQQYLDLLLRWNARTNLTAIRDPEQIVTRHFGESLFAAKALLRQPGPPFNSLADLGSGAGFPGVPIKLALPGLQVTLIESQNKKATFLKEVIRSLALNDIWVYLGRAEQWNQTADVITMRAVEKLESALLTAAKLANPAGRLCLLVSSAQVASLRQASTAGISWRVDQNIPGEVKTSVLVGSREW